MKDLANEINRIAERLKTPSADMYENLEMMGALVEKLVEFRNGLEEGIKYAEPHHQKILRFQVNDMDNHIAHYRKGYNKLKADLQKGKFDR